MKRYGTEAQLEYYPYGEERAPTPNGRDKFATYLRDQDGVDYADQRYYEAGVGRFRTADPALNSNAVVLPGNWNRYSYVGGDPINKNDPRGLCSPQDDPPCYSATGTAMAPGGAPPGGSRLVMGVDDAAAVPVTSNDADQSGGGAAPTNGGWGTDPSGAAKTAWQYLGSIWSNCLKLFLGHETFDADNFRTLLTGKPSEGGIAWWDTRDPAIAWKSVNSLTHDGDMRTLSEFLKGQGPGASAATLLPTSNVALAKDFFTNLTQTQQIAATIHEGLHIQFQGHDPDLYGILGTMGFKPNSTGSGAITDWIASGCK